MCVEKNKKFSKQVSMYGTDAGKIKYVTSYEKRQNLATGCHVHTRNQGPRKPQHKTLAAGTRFFFSKKNEGKSNTKLSPFHDAAYKGV